MSKEAEQGSRSKFLLNVLNPIRKLTTAKILIIDDEEKLRGLLSRILNLEGYEIIESGDCQSGLRRLEQEEFDLVLCDVKLPDGNGVELSKKIKEKYPWLEIILLTAYGNIPDGVQAIKNGAFDYITKGDDNNKIIPLISRALEKVELAKRVLQLEKQLSNKVSFEQILGKSMEIRAAIELAQKVAPTDATVLLTGETGTGKEVFAQAIHHASRRSRKNFVAVNCSAFSKELLESEMFGHIAGAFTGANKDQKGLFEEANNGTIFLDEIGEMPIDLQAKLLRVLETGEYHRLGESKTTKVDVRVITATNRQLPEQIKSGHFRSDLFYRISAFQILLPSLRERSGDIEEFVWHFAQLYAIKLNKKIQGISPDFLKAISLHPFPGNIRELKNILERALILMEGSNLDFTHLPLEIQQGIPDSSNELTGLSDPTLAQAEKRHIQKILRQTHGNKTETARLLNIALTTLYRKIEEYKLGE